MSELSPQMLFAQAVAAHQSGGLGEADALYRAVLRADPNSLAARANLAVIAVQRGDLEQAVDWLTQSLALDPAQPDVLFNRAGALAGLGRVQEAVADCQAVLTIDPAHLAAAERALALGADDAVTWEMHGLALMAAGRLEAVESLRRACDMDPGNRDYAYNLAVGATHLRRIDDAVAAYDRCIAIDPAFAVAYWNKARLLLAAGRPGEGWPLFEWRWKTPELAGRPHVSDAPEWLGAEDIAGKTLLLHYEQGFGDTLNMLRYLPLLKARGARTVLAVQPALHPLLTGLADQVLKVGEAIPPHDFQTFMMSLPMALGAASGAIPPSPRIVAPTGVAGDWARRLGPRTRRRIGLVWSGSRGHTNDANRSLTLAQLLPWLETDAEFISLQPDYRDIDLPALRAGPKLRGFAPLLTDFGETAGLIENLDLVISVDTAVAHLAGVMGKPVWILLSYTVDFRWGFEGDATPWYPSARLFRQPAPGDWASPIAAVELALRAGESS